MQVESSLLSSFAHEHVKRQKHKENNEEAVPMPSEFWCVPREGKRYHHFMALSNDLLLLPIAEIIYLYQQLTSLSSLGAAKK